MLGGSLVAFWFFSRRDLTLTLEWDSKKKKKKQLEFVQWLNIITSDSDRMQNPPPQLYLQEQTKLSTVQTKRSPQGVIHEEWVRF